MGLRHVIGVGSLADIATRRHDQLQELLDDDHTLYLRGLFQTTTLVTVGNTADETDLINTTIPANTLAVGRGLELLCGGDFFNNTVGAQTGLWRIRRAGIGDFSTGAVSLAQSALTRRWRLHAYWLVPATGLGSFGRVRWVTSAAGATGTGLAEVSPLLGTLEDGAFSDWTTDVNLRVTITLGVANVNLTVELREALIRVFR